MGMRMNKITEKFFNPLSVSQANMVPLILDRMQLFGITVDELSMMYDEFMKAHKEELRRQAKDIDFKVQKRITVDPTTSLKSPTDISTLNICKKCGSRVRRYKVNVSKCTKVKGDYTWAIQCINKDCLHTEYK